MVEFRFNSKQKLVDLKILNKYAPGQKTWSVDKYNGDYYIKILDEQNTQYFNNFLSIFLQIYNCSDTLTIIDSHKQRSHTLAETPRPTLF